MRRPELNPALDASPRPDHAALTVGIFAYLALAGWLMVRRRPGGA